MGITILELVFGTSCFILKCFLSTGRGWGRERSSTTIIVQAFFSDYYGETYPRTSARLNGADNNTTVVSCVPPADLGLNMLRWRLYDTREPPALWSKRLHTKTRRYSASTLFACSRTATAIWDMET